MRWLRSQPACCVYSLRHLRMPTVSSCATQRWSPVTRMYFLEADFDIVLNPTLEDALNKGVPLYFLLEFELIRPRWYWFSEKGHSTRNNNIVWHTTR